MERPVATVKVPLCLRMVSDRRRAEAALKSSLLRMVQAEQRRHETSEVTARLRDLRQQNHFGLMFARYLGGK